MNCRCGFPPIFAIVLATIATAGCTGSVVTGWTFSSPETSSMKAEHSWILPRATTGSLLYVSDDVLSEVYVLTYPQGKLAGILTGFDTPVGECVDATGNVWIANQSSSELLEYAHGGTVPIATLSEPGEYPNSCAVDQSSGDLAVANQNDVAIFAGAHGQPTTYSDPDISQYYYCTYDANGNLFVDGDVAGKIAELPHGSSSLSTILLSRSFYPLSMQWDGKYLALIELGTHGQRGTKRLDRVSVAGSSAKIVGTVLLKTPSGKMVNRLEQYWIAGSRVVGPDLYKRNAHPLKVLLWRYPDGGEPTKALDASWDDPWGITISPPTSKNDARTASPISR